MFCPNCGTELPNNARFCVTCGYNVYRGAHVKQSEEPENIALTAGELVIKRKKTIRNTDTAVIWLDGKKIKTIENGETVSVKLPPKQYTVMISQYGEDSVFFEVQIQSGLTKTLVYEPGTRGASDDPQTRNNSAAAFGKYGARTCPRCGGMMTTHVVTEARKAGCGTILLYLLLACTILGLFIVVPLMLRKKTETVTYTVCQSCGYQKEISRL